MNRRLGIAVLSTLIAGFVLGGCGAGDETASTEQHGAEASSRPESATNLNQASPAPSPPASASQIGGSLTLNAVDAVVEVKLLRIVDPANVTEKAQGRGERFVAVKVQVTNMGASPFANSLLRAAEVIDREGTKFVASTAVAIKPALESLMIPPGESRVGYVTFRVPDGSQLSNFTLTLGRDGESDTGLWRTVQPDISPPRCPCTREADS